MDGNFLFGISLTGSFLAGVLALFAPCCITFLLPSYLGTIFKRPEKVFFYTLIFSLGLSAVLVPVALGFKFIVSFFDSFHGAFYYLGALLLMLMGVMTLFEVRMPFSFSFTQKPSQKVDAASVFTLGVVSGLTSSCCAPVLLAAITLTSLSPTLLQAVVVAFAYVLGIVFPLFVLSLLFDKVSGTAVAQSRQKIYEIFKILGAMIFIVSGIVIALLNSQGKIVMGGFERESASLRMFIFDISRYFQNPILDLAVFGLILFIFYRLIKKT